MNMVASMSIIKGKGGVMSVMDNVVKKETERQEQMHEMEMQQMVAKHEAEIAELQTKCARQADRIKLLERQQGIILKYVKPSKKKGIRYELKECFAAFIAGFYCLGEKLGLVEYKEKEWKRK